MLLGTSRCSGLTTKSSPLGTIYSAAVCRSMPQGRIGRRRNRALCREQPGRTARIEQNQREEATRVRDVLPTRDELRKVDRAVLDHEAEVVDVARGNQKQQPCE